MIRQAELGDTDKLTELSRSVFESLGFNKHGHTFDYTYARDTVSKLIESPNADTFVLMSGDTLLGACGIILTPSLTSAQQIAHEWIWNADPDLPATEQAIIMAKLVKHITTRNPRCVLHFNVPCDSSAGRLLQRLGFNRAEQLWIKAE